MTKKYKKQFTTLSLTFAGIIYASTTHAAGTLGDWKKKLTTSAGKAGIKEETASLDVIIGNVIQVALSFIGLIFLVLMVYAGYLWMTARENEEQATKAKTIIRTTLIGLVITLSAYAITYLITAQLGSIG